MRFVGNIPIDISPNMLSPERVHQNCHASFGSCEHFLVIIILLCIEAFPLFPQTALRAVTSFYIMIAWNITRVLVDNPHHGCYTVLSLYETLVSRVRVRDIAESVLTMIPVLSEFRAQERYAASFINGNLEN